MKKRSVVFKISFLILSLWFMKEAFHCYAFAGTPTSRLYKSKITIGTAIWPGYLPLYVAQEKGYFKEAGLDVDVKLFIGLAEVSKDYTAGKIQGRANLTLDAVKERSEGFDHKIVLAIDYSNGSDAILARQDIHSVADFKGKSLGVTGLGSSTNFLTQYLAVKAGLQLSDITSVPVVIPVTSIILLP